MINQNKSNIWHIKCMLPLNMLVPIFVLGSQDTFRETEGKNDKAGRLKNHYQR